MLKRLKELTVIKKTETIKKEASNFNDIPIEDRKKTYRESGYRDSQTNYGDSTSLKIHLDVVYAKFRNEEKENKQKQEELKEPYRKEKAEKETIIKTTNVLISNCKDKKESRATKTENLKREIGEIPNNPEKYGIDAKKGAPVKFWIGLALLLPIALYLLVFYISASYSVFFKEYEIGATSFGQIFDPNSFVYAWKLGILAGVFVTFIPFVFFGLGFLIHMFGETKKVSNFIKIAVLFIVTFIFDVILAYVIEDKIYELTKTANSPDFNLSIALQKFEFWGIIFAGFIVYIIWGLVFDVVMKEHKEKDKIKMAINEHKSKIAIHQTELDKHEAELYKLKEENSKHQGRISELDRLIDAVIIPVKEYKLFASQYMQGWITAVSQFPLEEKEKQNLIGKNNSIYEEHLDIVGSSGNFQNKVYISNN